MLWGRCWLRGFTCAMPTPMRAGVHVSLHAYVHGAPACNNRDVNYTVGRPPPTAVSRGPQSHAMQAACGHGRAACANRQAPTHILAAPTAPILLLEYLPMQCIKGLPSMQSTSSPSHTDRERFATQANGPMQGPPIIYIGTCKVHKPDELPPSYQPSLLPSATDPTNPAAAQVVHATRAA